MKTIRRRRRAGAFEDAPTRLFGRLDLEALTQRPALLRRRAAAAPAPAVPAPGPAVDLHEDEDEGLQAGIIGIAVNAILLVTVFPVGLALSAFTLLTGGSLRVSCQAAGIAGLVAALGMSGHLPPFQIPF